MTWKSHRAVTFVTVLVLTNSIFASICASIGSTFPDQVEGANWQIGHRTFSHWFIMYLPFLYWTYSKDIFHMDFVFQNITGKELLMMMGFWYLIGCIFHILEDAVCGRVPFLWPTKRMRILPRLFYVGTTGEYIFVFLYCVGMIVFNVSR